MKMILFRSNLDLKRILKEKY